MYSLRMKNLILKIDSSPALQIKMASSKVTSSLSRASEATKSTTGCRLESLCTREEVTQSRKQGSKHPYIFALWQLTINKKRTNIVNCYLFTWINCGAMRAALRRSTPGQAVRAAVGEGGWARVCLCFVFVWSLFCLCFVFVSSLFCPFVYLGFVFVLSFLLSWFCLCFCSATLLWLSVFLFIIENVQVKFTQHDIMIVSWHNFYGETCNPSQGWEE